MPRKERPVDHRIMRARTLRRDMTEAEKLLWRHLRAEPFKVFHVRRQATIGPHFADFASHICKVVVEVDGGQHSDSKTDFARTLDLQRRGYIVVRFWNHDVLGNRESVLTRILDILTLHSTPHPRPLPAASAGGGERASLSSDHT